MENIILIGTYKKKDYPTIVSIVSDRYRMPRTWKKWKKSKKKAKKTLKGYGIKTMEIEISSTELIAFCKKNDLENINKKARSLFIHSKGLKSIQATG